jgi:hypothetical protein
MLPRRARLALRAARCGLGLAELGGRDVEALRRVVGARLGSGVGGADLFDFRLARTRRGGLQAASRRCIFSQWQRTARAARGECSLRLRQPERRLHALHEIGAARTCVFSSP